MRFFVVFLSLPMLMPTTISPPPPPPPPPPKSLLLAISNYTTSSVKATSLKKIIESIKRWKNDHER
jgi:hypothetical protein